ncbi:hypothetical protein [Jannaschia seohaensis]|uniref:Pectate lyase superfamily protein n=1 Tax=Jannaschia seohaensis TaxID=475081 RepID=A0A2Y9B7I5_9RHOB|nr:hypothetical protein [Jannaschia seohaensis]PWJ12456.1 hypothetical protein BCF38_11614 [Jannaschia seohaensis]SSA50937.1 hypothetical protein SAMN05421539_11614 [Jannaschia seohaensis]
MTETLDRFGARGDGRTDDTAAFQRAVEWSAAQGGAMVRATSGAVYRLTERIRSTGPLRLDLGDAELILDAEHAGLQAAARLEGPFDLRETQDGGTRISVALPDDTPLPAPGSWIKIVSDALAPWQRDRGSDDRVYAIAEWAEIGEGSTRSQLVLARPLRVRRGIDPRSVPGDEDSVWPWDTRYRPCVVWAHAHPVTIAGGVWAHPPNRDAWNAPTLLVLGHVDPLIERVHIARGYDTGIRLTGTQGARIVDCRAEMLASDPGKGRFGYGVADGGGRGTLVQGLRGTDTRSLFTTSIGPSERGERRTARLLGMGSSEAILVRDGQAGPHESAPWDTHHDGRHVTFERITATGGGGPAVSIRARETAVRGLVLNGTERGILVFTDWGGGREDGDNWLNGATRADYPMVQVADYAGTCRRRPIFVRAGTLSLTGTGRITTQACCGLRLSGGTVTVTGAHRIALGSEVGEEDDEEALIRLFQGHEKSRRIFGGATVDVAGLLELDGRAIGRAGTYGLYLEENTQVRVSGLLVLRLPALATDLRGGQGRLDILGTGSVAVTRPERDGAVLLDASGSTQITERALERLIAAYAPGP